MKFSIGDKVLLKHTGEEGTVVSYISGQMMEVEVDGTTFPVYSDQLDHPYLKWFTQQSVKQKKTATLQDIPAERLKDRQQRLARGIYLSFFPQFVEQSMEDVVQSIKVYLLNEMPVPVRFSYKVKLQHGTLFALDGMLHPFSNIYLHQIEFELMNDSPKFNWSLADASNEKMGMEEGVTKVRPDKLFGHINKLLQHNEPSFDYKLIDDFLPAPPKKTLPPVVVKPAMRTMKDLSKVTTVNVTHDFDPNHVIDLHIEKLMPDIKGMSNSMIMEFQLAALHRSLQNAIVNHKESLIIIHGVGTGVLRDAVHQVLSSMPEVLRYSNEWLGRYGYGATEVIFKK